MTCCEKLAIGLTAVAVTALGNIGGARDLLNTIKNAPDPCCKNCQDIGIDTIKALENNMKSYGAATKGFGVVASAVQELLYGVNS